MRVVRMCSDESATKADPWHLSLLAERDEMAQNPRGGLVLGAIPEEGVTDSGVIQEVADPSHEATRPREATTQEHTAFLIPVRPHAALEAGVILSPVALAIVPASPQEVADDIGNQTTAPEAQEAQGWTPEAEFPAAREAPKDLEATGTNLGTHPG